MTRYFIVLLSLVGATPAMACSPGLLERLDLRMQDGPHLSLDVAQTQSSEGGEWKLWQRADGSTEEVARIDYGEMGRLETRLLVDEDADYAVTQSRYSYSVPIYVENSITTRIETEIFYFCDGSLLLPAEDFGGDPDYVRRAEDARATFSAEEVSQYLPAGF
jgi:hypothetical protein